MPLVKTGTNQAFASLRFFRTIGSLRAAGRSTQDQLVRVQHLGWEIWFRPRPETQFRTRLVLFAFASKLGIPVVSHSLSP